MRFRWKEFGKDLRTYRKGCYMSLNYASRRCKINPATWSRAENGKPIATSVFIYLCAWMCNDPTQYLVRRPV
jgi:hypothetical protein